MNKLVLNSRRFFKRNSSTILTCIGAIGVVATAVVSAKDTIKAIKIIEESEEIEGVTVSKKELVKMVAPAYIPTAVVGLSTIACVFGANILNKRTQASLASAYALLDSSFKEYRERAKEVYGEDSDKKIKEAIAKNRYEDSQMMLKEDGKELFFDFHGLQLFSATWDEVKTAENTINQIINKNGYVGLNTFYEMLGIPCTDVDYEVGWSSRSVREFGYDHVEFLHDRVVNDDGTEFCAITMVCEPVEDYMWF